MKQTAMMELIDELKRKKKVYLEYSRNIEAEALSKIIEEAKIFLEKEKEQIIDAYKDGYYTASSFDEDAEGHYNYHYSKENK